MSTVSTTLLEANLPGLHLRHRGKVRDVFDLGDERLLIVATDRLSAFDVVLPDPIPGKGEMLCQISNFWFDRTASLMPNHLTGIPVADVLPAGGQAGPMVYEVGGRQFLVIMSGGHHFMETPAGDQVTAYALPRRE